MSVAQHGRRDGTARDLAIPLAPREESFTSRLRHVSVTARVGTWLGVAFSVALLTGLYSHYSQSFTPWFPLVTWSWVYRVTQGLHVIAGTAAVPLLLVKLWSVYPKLFSRLPWPPSRRLALHVAEKASILVLVASAIFELATGLANIAHWYPWSFSFRSTHYAVGLLAFGSIVLHVAIKMPFIREGWAQEPSRDARVRDAGVRDAAVRESPLPDGGTAAPREEPVTEVQAPAAPLSRRSLLNLTWGATGLAVLATAGSTVPFLRDVSLFAVRSGDGPLGVPINRTAREAGVGEGVGDGWSVVVRHAGQERTFTRADLEAMPQSTHDLPIACVEGWSASATWTGVPLRDLMAAVGAPSGSDVKVASAQTRGAFSRTFMPALFADDPRTLLALRLNGEELTLDHGYPARIIAPGRPGVLQTKWVTALGTTA